MNEIKYDQELANKITPREMQVIGQMIEGYSSRQIARVLGITINTVEVHRKRIYRKTGSKNPAQLVMMLCRGGILV